MWCLPLVLLALLGTALAGEPAYPLWDGHETVEQYAKRVNLPPTKSLDLGNGVKLELVLIPAGKFNMGTPEPVPVDEDGFHKKILTGQVLLAVSSGLLLVMLAVIIVQAIRKRQKPKYSLLWLLAMTVTAGGCITSGFYWKQAVQAFELAKAEYEAAVTRCAAAGSMPNFSIEGFNEKPAHPVTLTKPFYMGKFVVTQKQWQQVMGTNPSKSKDADNPVETVSWDESQAFCKKLTETSMQVVRLPTEAEWEYACRAKTTTTYYTGDTEDDLSRAAWYLNNSGFTIHPVGQKEPNPFGLYDMHGNVCQWCEDYYAKDYYGESPSENPQGPARGIERVMRGGFWSSTPLGCRSACRDWWGPDGPENFIGFRVVVEPAFKTP